MTLVNVVFGALLGACLGSFLTCAAWRMPRRISLGGRSICPSCRTPLRARWNVPVVGWLALRGRAGCCGAPIGVRYVLIELAVCGAWAALAGALGLMAAWVGMLVIVALTAAGGRLTQRHSPPA